MYEFSEAAANFTKCAVQYARPIQLCEHCYPVYQQAIAIYDIMMKGNVTEGDGILCGETILNADRVQIVVTTAMFIATMWSNSSCDNCYVRENDTVVYKLNNLTVNFKALVNRTFECFLNSSHGNLTPYSPNVANETVCNDCRALYQQLNNLYKDLEKAFPKHVCMDLVDSMNRTRLIWSRDFRCSRLHGSVAGVMVLSVFFCSLPFAFYIGSRVRGTAVHRKLLKQKRLKNVVSVPDMAGVIGPGEDESLTTNIQSDEGASS
ncbi:Osteopetrosis-associated transmembrane protein 1 [Lamellibrachia satsuma]|nr:Osteopetrosis-associated transmembrane protein 1 [Lamellibrachia satsuma]